VDSIVIHSNGHNDLFCFLSHKIRFPTTRNLDTAAIHSGVTEDWNSAHHLRSVPVQNIGDVLLLVGGGSTIPLLTYLRTELSSSWEAANCAAIQEIPSQQF
jgi:hypothetical protein